MLGDDRIERVDEGGRVIGTNYLIERLRGICGERVIAHKDQMRAYESDGLLQYRGSPVAVVLPDTAAEVQEVVRACYEARPPSFVPSSARCRVIRWWWPARSGGAGCSWKETRGHEFC